MYIHRDWKSELEREVRRNVYICRFEHPPLSRLYKFVLIANNNSQSKRYVRCDWVLIFISVTLHNKSVVRLKIVWNLITNVFYFVSVTLYGHPTTFPFINSVYARGEFVALFRVIDIRPRFPKNHIWMCNPVIVYNLSFLVAGRVPSSHFKTLLPLSAFVLYVSSRKVVTLVFYYRDFHHVLQLVFLFASQCYTVSRWLSKFDKHNRFVITFMWSVNIT